MGAKVSTVGKVTIKYSGGNAQLIVYGGKVTMILGGRKVPIFLSGVKIPTRESNPTPIQSDTVTQSNHILHPTLPTQTDLIFKAGLHWSKRSVETKCP